MLSVTSRDARDPRTSGGLFFDCCNELDDLRFIDALRLLLELLRTALDRIITQDHDVIEQIVQQFIEHLPITIKAKLAA